MDRVLPAITCILTGHMAVAFPVAPASAAVAVAGAAVVAAAAAASAVIARLAAMCTASWCWFAGAPTGLEIVSQRSVVRLPCPLPTLGTPGWRRRSERCSVSAFGRQFS
jgi:hypothetical protein